MPMPLAVVAPLNTVTFVTLRGLFWVKSTLPVSGDFSFAERVLGFWYYMKASDLPAGFADGLRKHYRGEHLPAELPESLDTYKAWLSTKS